MATLQQIIGEHRNEWIVVEQVRPDLEAAPTSMVAVDSQSYVDEYGDRVTSPSGWDYLTQVSANDRGETLTELASTPVVLDGSTYVHRMTVSDRTCGPMLFVLEITGTAATTLSWLVNARMSGDSGTGTAYQPNEIMDVGGGTSGGLGVASEGYYRHNPTRDGETAEPFTLGCVPGFPPTPMPYRDNRVHGSMPLHFSASGETFKSCVRPMEFSPSIGPAGTPCDGVGPKGRTATRSICWYGHRLYQEINLRWGSTTHVQATTHRVDTWSYAPVKWDETNTTTPLVCGLSTLASTRAAYWDEATIYDLADMSTFPIPDGAVEHVAGTDNFYLTQAFRRFLTLYTSDVNGALTLVAGVVRDPVASPYAAILLRNSSTDIAMAIVTKFGNPTPGGPGEETEVAQEYLEDLPDFIGLLSFWSGTHSPAADRIEQPWSMGTVVDSRAIRRRRGWVGNVHYRCIGRTAHVLQAMQDLYTTGDLDLPPNPDVPAEVSEGTLWGDHLMALIVEDGTGRDVANSYASLADADDYFDGFGGNATWTAATDLEQEDALRYATMWIDAQYGQQFAGYRLQATQALEAPRTMLWANGRTIEGVPVELKRATAEAAVRWLTNPADLFPDVAVGGNVQSETKTLGPLSRSVSFVGGKSTAKEFPIVLRLLRQSGLLGSGSWVTR